MSWLSENLQTKEMEAMESAMRPPSLDDSCAGRSVSQECLMPCNPGRQQLYQMPDRGYVQSHMSLQHKSSLRM